MRSTASSGYDSSESGSGSESGAGGKYDLISHGAVSPIMRRHQKETRDLLVSSIITPYRFGATMFVFLFGWRILQGRFITVNDVYVPRALG